MIATSTASSSNSSLAPATAAAAVSSHFHQHHQADQQQQHSRSHSDPTRNNTQAVSLGYHHLRTPESDFARLAGPSEHDDLFQTANLKKRKLNLDECVDDFIDYEFKRSRTAPPSPPYEIDADLKLKSPMAINMEHVIERARSLSPTKFLNTPVASSDPIEHQAASTAPAQIPSSPISQRPSTVTIQSRTLGSMDDYPDTCYKFSSPATNFNTDPYNEEWKQRLEILIKADNPVTYSHLKDYCNDLNKSSLHKLDFDSKISHKIQKNTSKRLSSTISSRYKLQHNKMKISSIVNFPFESNYTYQSSGYLKDIEMLNKNSESLKKKSAVDLDKYNYIFKQQLAMNAAAQVQEPLPQMRRLSAHHGMVTTDLPLHFSSSHSRQAMQYSTPASTQYLKSIPDYRQQQHQPATSPARATFVNATSPAKSYHHLATPSTRILPPTTPKMSSSSLLSPSTSPSSKAHSHHGQVRTCISCKSVQSPCWRPSWSIASGQLCNSCGLRYKKTGAHCLNDKCLRIPAKGEWTLMKNRGKLEFFDEKTNEVRHCYKCLHCGGEVEVNE